MKSHLCKYCIGSYQINIVIKHLESNDLKDNIVMDFMYIYIFVYYNFASNLLTLLN